jgi:hypothetical protein
MIITSRHSRCVYYFDFFAQTAPPEFFIFLLCASLPSNSELLLKSMPKLEEKFVLNHLLPKKILKEFQTSMAAEVIPLMLLFCQTNPFDRPFI